jgi:hypothetical protein
VPPEGVQAWDWDKTWEARDRQPVVPDNDLPSAQAKP